MTFFRKHIKAASTGLVLLFVFSLVGPAFLPSSPAAGASGVIRTIGDLNIGDKVMDLTWEWEHKTGDNYSGEGEKKPVTWIVVAKNHYQVEGGQSNVTLLSEELIGKHPFDDSTNRGDSMGSNHWGNSGTPNAVHGLRPFLNSLDKGSYSYAGDGFYAAFSQSLQDTVLTTTVPNKVFDTKTDYTTQDKVFVPSYTELGVTENTLEIGTVFPYFDGLHGLERRAKLAGTFEWYWTRSPTHSFILYPFSVQVITAGIDLVGYAAFNNIGVRPAINLPTDIPVLEKDGVYVLHWPPQTIGNLKIGDRVVDTSWQWEHKPDAWYSGSGQVKPVTWIVVAKDHYNEEGGRSHVTLLSEELLFRYPFDDSSGRFYGSGHWGDSGTPNASHGLRPFLNSLDKRDGYSYTGDGFYAVFSQDFKDAVLTTQVPNRTFYETPYDYETEDKVFVPSTTELGGTDLEGAHEIGTVYPYFQGATDEDRIARFAGSANAYWTRSPSIGWKERVFYVYLHGAFGTWSSSMNFFIRPAVNISSGVVVSGNPNDDGVFEISWTRPISNLQIGDRVADISWEWEHKTGTNYTGSGEIKPVTWIVVARNHYAGLAPHVTLLSEELIGRHAFDDSTDRPPYWGGGGSNHWGNSGTPDAQHGQRPFLNSLDKENNYAYAGAGFYAAFSQSFRDAVLPTALPNATQYDVAGNYDDTNPWRTYNTSDHVFILSQTEMGGGDAQSHTIGTVMPYFDVGHTAGPANQSELTARRQAGFGGDGLLYYTRSPSSGSKSHLRNVGTDGFFSSYAANLGYRGMRPALNLSTDLLVSAVPDQHGVYRIIHLATLTVTKAGEGSVKVNGAAVSLPYSEEHPTNTSVMLEAVAAEGWQFTGWKVDGATVPDSNGVIIVAMNAARQAVAVFTEEDPAYGDVNDDGKVSADDAVSLKQHIAGLFNMEDEYGPDAMLRARVSGDDGDADLGDAILILRYITGQINEFPVEQ